ncbi:hypothetical protein [Planococcus shixiaomingii]|uniref:hypothetical protein n=1 Tax=Planococcus shixiaomingii TaxID=3058393 RepID=UPI00261F5507|nr:hypothetical protein [Planococcus sp. N022]WKA53184.1 hypothetical protein QWY21_10980 [Planococcus sp. N022]
MEGVVCLIKISADRIVPALCLKEVNGSYSFAQIRRASNEDIVNIQPAKNEKVKDKKRKKEENQMTNNKKQEVDSIYIGQPAGLKSTSVVMLRKIFLINNNAIIKQIAEVPIEDYQKCLQTFRKIKRINELHQQLHRIKKKIQLAQYNNEKYGDLEKLKDQILKEIGYSNQPLFEKEKKPYKNFREVPNKGRIKVYYGGR